MAEDAPISAGDRSDRCSAPAAGYDATRRSGSGTRLIATARAASTSCETRDERYHAARFVPTASRQTTPTRVLVEQTLYVPSASVPVFRTGVREAWEFRELLRRLLVRNLKVRYQRSVLGFVWALLNPLATITILVAVFSYIIRIGVPHYWAFLVSGYFAWVFLLHTVTSASAVITDHSYLARGAAFPTEILVFAAAGARLIEFGIEMVLVMIVLAIFHHGGVPPSFALTPVLVVILTLLVLGLALPVASLAVFFHDVQHALPVALSMLAYVSPIFYPITLIPERVRDVFLINPVAILVSLFHGVLYQGQWPSLLHLMGATAMALAVYLLGYAGFRRHRAFIPETV